RDWSVTGVQTCAISLCFYRTSILHFYITTSYFLIQDTLLVSRRTTAVLLYNKSSHPPLRLLLCLATRHVDASVPTLPFVSVSFSLLPRWPSATACSCRAGRP